MKSETSYSVQYRVIHGFRTSTSSSLNCPTLKELRDEMERLIQSETMQATNFIPIQAIIFERIVKTVKTKIETKGSFIQFVKKFDKRAYYGEDEVDKEFYKPLKHRGSGRQGNSLQKSFK